jgi:hypothetical protein
MESHRTVSQSVLLFPLPLSSHALVFCHRLVIRRRVTAKAVLLQIWPNVVPHDEMVMRISIRESQVFSV